MVEKSDVSDILSKKCLLIKGLEENIFKDFTSEEEDLLHSKHGRIKVGLPVIINCNPVKTVPKITTIDWDSHMFQTIDGDWFNFEFTPIKLRELTSLI